MGPIDTQAIAANRGVSLRLLGTRVRLEGPAELVGRFELRFRWFLEPPDRADPQIAVRIRARHAGNRVSIEERGATREFDLDTDDQTFGFLYARLLDQVTRRDPDLLCVHAAALARDGRGIALAAPSRHGKSTLALSLAARGFRFLSDEVAPIRNDPPSLLPFPMAIACRRGTHALLRGTVFADHRFQSRTCLGKTLYDPSAVTDGRVDPVPLEAVFFIEPARTPERGSRTYRMILHRSDDTLARAVAEIDGVVSARHERGGAELIVEIGQGAWVAPAVEELLERRRMMACEVEDLSAPKPDFDSDPRLHRLSTTEGVVSLFRHLRGFGAVQDLVRGTPGGFGARLADLALSMRRVGFFQLTPGRLPSMIERIESVLPAGAQP